ncbi:hypothetical protein D3C80_966310 [compost metagenome]
MQLEVVAVDAQLCQLVSGDQQVQRWLFIAEVIANDLRQVRVAMLPQGQLQAALEIPCIVQWHRLYTPQATQQTLVDQHMIATRVTIAELFQVSPDQTVETWVAPVLQRAVQPGSIHRFGRCNLLQKPQRMCAAGKEAAWCALPALLKVLGVAGGDIASAPRAPGWQIRR